jgi:hypothetical protein
VTRDDPEDPRSLTYPVYFLRNMSSRKFLRIQLFPPHTIEMHYPHNASMYGNLLAANTDLIRMWNLRELPDEFGPADYEIVRFNLNANGYAAFKVKVTL